MGRLLLVAARVAQVERAARAVLDIQLAGRAAAAAAATTVQLAVQVLLLLAAQVAQVAVRQAARAATVAHPPFRRGLAKRERAAAVAVAQETFRVAVKAPQVVAVIFGLLQLLRHKMSVLPLLHLLCLQLQLPHSKVLLLSFQQLEHFQQG
jgi:hypothetical protein